VASFAPESFSSLIVQESRTEQIAGFSEHRGGNQKIQNKSKQTKNCLPGTRTGERVTQRIH